MASRVFINAMLQRPDDLLRLVCAFNVDPLGFVHPSRLERFVSAPISDYLGKSRRVHRKLARMLMEKLGIDGLSNRFYHFEEAHYRLALVENETLIQLLNWVGAAYYSQQIKRLVSKEQVIALQKAIGSDGYEFAVKRAPFLISPEALKLSAYEESPSDIVAAVRKAGVECFEICFAGAPISFQKRFSLKFPEGIEFDFTRVADPEDQKRAWKFLRKILIREISPKWAGCFT